MEKPTTQREICESEYKRFGKRWGIHPGGVRYIHHVIVENERRWTKAAVILVKENNFDLTPRQLRYFCLRIDLLVRLKNQRPQNYSEMLRKSA